LAISNASQAVNWSLTGEQRLVKLNHSTVCKWRWCSVFYL